MNRLPHLGSALVALLLAVLCTAPAAAQQRTSLESLVQSSEAVVVARAVRTESFWNEDRTAILTRVVLEVEDQIEGQTPTRTEVIIPGGQIGDIRHEVSDMPHFEVNEEAIVFMERHRTGIFVVSGGQHGKLPVTRDSRTGVRLVGGVTELFEVVDGEDASASDEELLPLDDFKLRYKKLRDRR
jgi:hypothetical protein